MKSSAAVAIAAAFVTLAGAVPAGAQTRFQQAAPPTRGFISGSGLFQAGGSSFTDRFEFQEFVETGSIESTFEAKPAIGVDGSIGIRLWRNLGIGLGFTTYTPGSRDDGGGTVTARIPHPLHFNQHREVSGDANLRRGETAVHGSLLYFVPSRSKLHAVIGAGATLFQAEQSFVRDVQYNHSYPYDEAVFTGVDHDTENASGLGFHASVDVAWRFTRSFGVGGLVRYAHGTLAFTPGERQLKLDVGGLQAGLGVRVLF